MLPWQMLSQLDLGTVFGHPNAWYTRAAETVSPSPKNGSSVTLVTLVGLTNALAECSIIGSGSLACVAELCVI